MKTTTILSLLLVTAVIALSGGLGVHADPSYCPASGYYSSGWPGYGGCATCTGSDTSSEGGECNDYWCSGDQSCYNVINCGGVCVGTCIALKDNCPYSAPTSPPAPPPPSGTPVPGSPPGTPVPPPQPSSHPYGGGGTSKQSSSTTDSCFTFVLPSLNSMPYGLLVFSLCKDVVTLLILGILVDWLMRPVKTAVAKVIQAGAINRWKLKVKIDTHETVYLTGPCVREGCNFSFEEYCALISSTFFEVSHFITEEEELARVRERLLDVIAFTLVDNGYWIPLHWVKHGPPRVGYFSPTPAQHDAVDDKACCDWAKLRRWLPESYLATAATADATADATTAAAEQGGGDGDDAPAALLPDAPSAPSNSDSTTDLHSAADGDASAAATDSGAVAASSEKTEKPAPVAGNPAPQQRQQELPSATAASSAPPFNKITIGHDELKSYVKMGETVINQLKQYPSSIVYYSNSPNVWKKAGMSLPSFPGSIQMLFYCIFMVYVFIMSLIHVLGSDVAAALKGVSTSEVAFFAMGWSIINSGSHGTAVLIYVKTVVTLIHLYRDDVAALPLTTRLPMIGLASDRLLQCLTVLYSVFMLPFLAAPITYGFKLGWSPPVFWLLGFVSLGAFHLFVFLGRRWCESRDNNNNNNNNNADDVTNVEQETSADSPPADGAPVSAYTPVAADSPDSEQTADSASSPSSPVMDHEARPQSPTVAEASTDASPAQAKKKQQRRRARTLARNPLDDVQFEMHAVCHDSTSHLRRSTRVSSLGPDASPNSAHEDTFHIRRPANAAGVPSSTASFMSSPGDNNNNNQQQDSEAKTQAGASSLSTLMAGEGHGEHQESLLSEEQREAASQSATELRRGITAGRCECCNPFNEQGECCCCYNTAWCCDEHAPEGRQVFMEYFITFLVKEEAAIFLLTLFLALAFNFAAQIATMQKDPTAVVSNDWNQRKFVCYFNSLKEDVDNSVGDAKEGLSRASHVARMLSAFLPFG